MGSNILKFQKIQSKWMYMKYTKVLQFSEQFDDHDRFITSI